MKRLPMWSQISIFINGYVKKQKQTPVLNQVAHRHYSISDWPWYNWVPLPLWIRCTGPEQDITLYNAQYSGVYFQWQLVENGDLLQWSWNTNFEKIAGIFRWRTCVWVKMDYLFVLFVYIYWPIFQVNISSSFSIRSKLRYQKSQFWNLFGPPDVCIIIC